MLSVASSVSGAFCYASTHDSGSRQHRRAFDGVREKHVENCNGRLPASQKLAREYLANFAKSDQRERRNLRHDELPVRRRRS